MSEFIFKESQDPEIIRKIANNCASQWSSFEKPSSFVDSEYECYKISSNVNHEKVYSFYLEHQETGEIATSLRVYIKKVYLKQDSSSETKLVNLFHLSFVFTLQPYRGQKLANILIHKAIDQVESEYEGTDSYWALYSGVGEYYKRFGFKSLSHLKFNMLHHAVEEDSTDLDTSFIKHNDTETLCKIANSIESRNLTELEKCDNRNPTFVYKPMSGNFKIFHRRELEFESYENCGVTLNNSDGFSYILWGNYIMHNKLCVLALGIPESTDESVNLKNFQRLIKSVLRESKKRNLKLGQIMISDDDLPTKNRQIYIDCLKKDFNSDCSQGTDLRYLPAVKKIGSKDPDFDVDWKGIGFWCWS